MCASRQVWYASYGSNMHRTRLAIYLAGCRDTRSPQRSVPVELPGSMYFAYESKRWTGGMAFYDPEAPGTVWARAHLLTEGQFADIATQEMHGVPGPEGGLAVDFGGLGAGERVVLGDGRYETVVGLGELEGLPLVTCTAPWAMADIAWRKPAERYLGHVAAGLVEAGKWEGKGIVEYLAGRPGVAGEWGVGEIKALVEAAGEG
ncbi:histone deacetylase [Streptomyces sp. NBC_01537]|uniref:histone deacetylase n=1 Tax=Streptomyces sp. NBC_01537 TaxID=2903896 RepID=UPI0038670BD6